MRLFHESFYQAACRVLAINCQVRGRFVVRQARENLPSEFLLIFAKFELIILNGYVFHILNFHPNYPG